MRFSETGHLLGRTTQLLMLVAALSVTIVSGQEPHARDQTAPPPLKIISHTERAELDESKDPKDRVRTTLDLAAVHLTEAETQTSQHEYTAAAAAAGRYWALIEDLLGFLRPMKTDSNKTRDLYKRVELGLRAHGPRLSAIRRGTPAEYSVWIKKIEDFAREGRTEALDSFYGTTVLREKSVDPKQVNKSLQKNSITPDKNQP